jgi:hypothetical protein
MEYGPRVSSGKKGFDGKLYQGETRLWEKGRWSKGHGYGWSYKYK